MQTRYRPSGPSCQSGQSGQSGSTRLAVLARLALLAACAGGGAAQAQAQAHEPEGALYQAFAIAAPATWGRVVLDPRPEAWRIGAADGPPASAAQLRLVLAGLAGIEVGGRCAGWAEGPTTYPCGFALRGFGVDGGAGTVGERFSAVAFDLQPASDAARRATATPRAELAAAGLIAPVLDAPRFVAVRVPTRALGDRATLVGRTLSFEFRALSNWLVPSVFDRSGGVVVLRPAAAHTVKLPS